MGFFSEVTDALGVTNKSGERAIRNGIQDMERATTEGVEALTHGRRFTGEAYQPFINTGKQALTGMRMVAATNPEVPRSFEGHVTSQFAGRKPTVGLAADGQGALEGEVLLNGELDPNVLNSPFFKALQENSTREIAQSAAGRGKLGSFGTKEAIAKNNMLLGHSFAQEDLKNRLTTQSQRFNQLQSALGFGLQGGLAEDQNELNYLNSYLGQRGNARQTKYANQLTSNQNAFNIQQALANMGLNATSNLVGHTNATQSGIANLRTGLGNAQAFGGIQAANAGQFQVKPLVDMAINAKKAGF